MSMWRRRSLVDSLIDEAFRRFEKLMSELSTFEYEKPMWDSNRSCLEPLAEVEETDEEIIVRVDMPYVDKENVKVQVVENVLIIEASIKHVIKFDRWGTFQREAAFYKYYKEIPLPAKVKAEEAKASLRRGILEIRLPKDIKKFTIKVE